MPRPTLLGVALGEGWAFHVYVVVLAAGAALFLWRVVRSPLGHVLIGIQENEGRMEAVGYPIRRYKLLAFVVAGILAGLAGALYAQFSGSITPDAFFWTTSGEALLMVIIGGTGTIVPWRTVRRVSVACTNPRPSQSHCVRRHSAPPG